MNDLKSLLAKALDEVPADAPVDPAADLARGRTRLLRRRVGAVAGAAAIVLGAGAVPFVLNAGGAEPILAGSPAQTTPGAGWPALALIAYTGEQEPGYRVATVPAGWEIQGSDRFVLTIAEKGAESQDYTNFYGKIAVMLQSKDAAPPTSGTPQEVAGRPGRLDVGANSSAGTQILTYQAADGRWMVIQAPAALGWSGVELARFAAGVEVLDNAEAGVG